MNPRSIATHLRALPRPAALSRPSPSRSHSIVASRYTPIATLRSYSTAQAEGSDAAASTSPDGAAKSPEQEAADKKSAELSAKVKELERDLLYQRAEIQTLTRRIADEKSKATEFAISSFARSLLTTTDTLTTALSHVSLPIDNSAQPQLSQLYSGVELTRKAMLKTFEQAGVRKMEVEQGSVFDPNLHEAAFQIPKEMAGVKKSGGEWGKGEVVEVSKEGWVIGNRVLRPAQVGVTQIE